MGRKPIAVAEAVTNGILVTPRRGRWRAMNHSTAQARSDRAALGCALLSGFALLVAAGSAPASTPIYKCFDKNFALVYTDKPCKDGERLDIRAGDADPAAVARVERARDALDASVAQRLADQRRAALDRSLAAQYAMGGVPIAYDFAPPPPYDYGWLAYPVPAYRSFARDHRLRHFAPPAPDHRRVVPAKPRVVQRR